MARMILQMSEAWGHRRWSATVPVERLGRQEVSRVVVSRWRPFATLPLRREVTHGEGHGSGVYGESGGGGGMW